MVKNLLIICRNDWANVSYRLMEAVNRYNNGWNARCIVRNKHPYDYPYDILANNKNRKLICALMGKADFILYGSSCYYRPFRCRVNKKCKQGIWHGGSTFRTKYKWYDKRIHPRVDIVFAHRDMENLLPNIYRLQAPFDTDKYNFVARPRPPIVIGHTPSRPKIKKTHIFERVKKNIENKYDSNEIKIYIKTGLSYDECMNWKKKFHIYFDQISGYCIPKKGTHGYGLNLIESASMGSICMGGANYKDTPIIYTPDGNAMEKAICNFIENPELIEDKMKETRRWVVREHGYKAISEKFLKDISTVI